MAYKKFVLLLKGRSRGLLTLEIKDKLAYSFSCPFMPGEADVVLFFDENTFIRLPGTAGEATVENAGAVCAAALVKGREFLMTGRRCSFDWRRAKTGFAMKTAPKVGMPLRGEKFYEPLCETVDRETPTLNELMHKIIQEEKKKQHILPAEGKPVVETREVYRKESQKQEKPVEKEILEEIRQMEASIFKEAAGEKTEILQMPIREPREETPPQKEAQTNTPDAVGPSQTLRTQSCIRPEEAVASPFSHLFENSVWRKIKYPYIKGRKHYLVGEIFREDKELLAVAVAVPGEYALKPPAWLKGFNTYLNSDDGFGGYWVYIRNAITGKPTTIQEVLNTLL